MESKCRDTEKFSDREKGEKSKDFGASDESLMIPDGVGCLHEENIASINYSSPDGLRKSTQSTQRQRELMMPARWLWVEAII